LTCLPTGRKDEFDMSDLPKGWIEVPLSEILISLESGSRPKGGVRGIKEGIPSIGGEHLNERGGFNLDKIKYVPKNFAEKMTKGKIKKKDILIVKDGATTGKVSFVDNSFPFNDAVINEHVFICRTFSDINSKYVFRFLFSEKGQKRILANFKGSAQGGINLSFAPNTSIPLPPLNEQKQIVEKLDKLLAKVEAAKERLDKIPGILKKYRQSVLHTAVTGELTKEWREENNLNKQKSIELLNEIFAELKKHYPQKKFRKINLENNFAPSRWTNSYMDNLFEVQTGATPLRKNLVYWENGNIPWIKSGEVNNSDIKKSSEFITELAIEETNVKLFPKETILVAMYGEGKTRGQVGILKLEATTNQACAALVNPNLNAITRKFVYLYCLSQYEDIRRKSSGGNQPNLNLSKIKDWIISIPSLEEQKEIVSRVEKLLSTADEIEARYKKAKEYVDKLSQSILAKAFRGELVPQDPNDEPAEKLLERIKAEKEKEEKKKKRPIKRHK
jgi:type I restriction enzyme S subunit